MESLARWKLFLDINGYKEQIIKYGFIAFVNLLENIFSMEAELAKAFPLLLRWYHSCLPLPPLSPRRRQQPPTNPQRGTTSPSAREQIRSITGAGSAPAWWVMPCMELSTVPCARGHEGVMWWGTTLERSMNRWASAPCMRAPCLFSSHLQVLSSCDPVSYQQSKASSLLSPSNQPSNQQHFSLGRKEKPLTNYYLVNLA